MKHNATTDFFARYADVLMQLVVGLIFLFAGIGKLFTTPGIAGFGGMLAGLGFPVPTFFAVLVGIVEFLGGILLILGLFTRISSVFLGIVVLVAILTTHLNSTWPYPVLLFAVLLRYIGAGTTCSLQDAIYKKHKSTRRRRKKK